MTSELDALIKHMCYKGCRVNPMKIQGAGTSVQFTGIQRSRMCLDIVSKVKDRLHLASPTTKKEAFYRAWLACLDCILQVTQKAASFVRDLEQERGLQESRLWCQQLCHLAYDLPCAMVLGVLLVEKDAVLASIASPTERITVQALGFWTKTVPVKQVIICPLRNSP